MAALLNLNSFQPNESTETMESLETPMNTRRQSIVFGAPIVIPLTNSHPQSEFTLLLNFASKVRPEHAYDFVY